MVFFEWSYPGRKMKIECSNWIKIQVWCIILFSLKFVKRLETQMACVLFGEVIGLIRVMVYRGYLPLEITAKVKAQPMLTPPHLSKAYSNLIWAELSVAKKKIKCFPSILLPKENLMPLIFRTVKGRNNDFLFDMHISFFLLLSSGMLILWEQKSNVVSGPY